MGMSNILRVRKGENAVKVRKAVFDLAVFFISLFSYIERIGNSVSNEPMKEQEKCMKE